MSRFIEWPWALSLTLLLPLLALSGFSLERRLRARRLARLGTRGMLDKLAPLRARFGAWRTVRLVTVAALCSFAFAGPRWGIGKIVARSDGADVALVLDASLSMMAPDAPPTRLGNMKDVVRQLYTMSPNDRFALLAFAGHSYIFSPLTTDRSAIDLYLSNLDPSTVGMAGSSMASAIHQAVTLLSLRHGDASRAIVLMSDGEAFEPMTDITTEAKRAAEAGITLVTVGFGTERGSTIPVKGLNGAPTLKRDAAGDIVVTRYTPATLSQAAQAAHGLFIPATAPNKAVQIRRLLDGLRARPGAAEIGEHLTLQFQRFVLPAFLILLLDTLLVLRPGRRRTASPDTATPSST